VNTCAFVHMCDGEIIHIMLSSSSLLVRKDMDIICCCDRRHHLPSKAYNSTGRNRAILLMVLFHHANKNLGRGVYVYVTAAALFTKFARDVSTEPSTTNLFRRHRPIRHISITPRQFPFQRSIHCLYSMVIHP